MWINTTNMHFILLFILVGVLSPLTAAVKLNNKKFSDDFMFGCATSAYQVEGAWNESGKGLSIWDTFTHKIPSPTTNGGTGDVACDSYHKYKEDVALLANMGVNHYRFSISWARLLPTGQPNNINQAAVTFYKNLILELKKNNIEPLVTLLHNDSPQSIEDMGGWTHPEFADWFADYARVCFKLFGEHVKYWVTFNEARVQCVLGYGRGFFPPVKNSPGVGEYMCIHNVLRAHAAAWHVYNDNFRATQKGHLGITIDTDWYEPLSNSEEDLKASENMLLFQFGTFGHSLYYGDYPDIVTKTIKRRSLVQGYSKSRLPPFTEEDKKKLKGTVDFFGINIYVAYLVTPLNSENLDGLGLNEDCEVQIYSPDYLTIAPWGAGKLVRWISKTYNNIPIIITENGFGDDSPTKESLDDPGRISFIQQYLSSIKDAVDDGVNVKGYTVWSLIDTFEFRNGFSRKYGLHHVDFQSPNKTRTPRQSAKFYKHLIESRCLVTSCIDA